MATPSNIVRIPSASLPSQPWWPEAHSMIIEAYLSEVNNVLGFPPTWTRLNTNPAKGAHGLAQELGDHGHLFVALSDEGSPLGCSGVRPSRGEHWVHEHEHSNDAETTTNGILPANNTSEEIPDWEICCFCVSPSARGLGLSYQLINKVITFIKTQGAKRLVSNYIALETGNFWPKLGFELVPGAGGKLPKGFKNDPDKEALRADIHCLMGVKRLV